MERTKTVFKVITYELHHGFKDTYKYKGKAIEKHMEEMYQKGWTAKTQTEGGNEYEFGKAFVKTAVFGVLGLIGNRKPKHLTVIYTKEVPVSKKAQKLYSKADELRANGKEKKALKLEKKAKKVE
jgi:hypothetical protein